jgi:hypothetical protein
MGAAESARVKNYLMSCIGRQISASFAFRSLYLDQLGICGGQATQGYLRQRDTHEAFGAKRFPS